MTQASPVQIPELANLTLAQAAAGLRKGDFSSLELVRECLSRITQYGPELNCFVAVSADHALRQARQADTQRRHGPEPGPLHGIPFAEKDMFFQRGQISSMGSRLGRRFTPTSTATVYRKLDQAGAISVGRLHMTEFAAGPTGQNEYLGSCRNPWNSDYISGGSSSGAGCAVAARMVYGALGSDTGGSIRLPAGMCGVVGLKPTHGLVSRHGGMPRCWSLDVFGPIARTALDCALMLEVIEGVDDNDPATYTPHAQIRPNGLGESVKGIRIGVPRKGFVEQSDSQVAAAVNEALSVLRTAGCAIVPIDLPATDPIFALTQIVNKAEAAALHAEWLGAYPDEYGLSAKARIEAGFYIPAPLYLWALSARPNILRDFVATVFADVDAVMLPLLDRTVPSIQDARMNASGDVPAIVDGVTRHTRWVNYLGLPAVAAPCGFCSNGLPISFQLLGRPYSEQLLLNLVHQHETWTSWHRRVPLL